MNLGRILFAICASAALFAQRMDAQPSFPGVQVRMPEVILPADDGDSPVGRFLFRPAVLPALIDADELRADVEFLSDGICRGRGFGTTGALQAAEMIASRFAQSGLRPLGDSWFQTFRQDGKTGRNVVGMLPSRNGRYIVVGAYYDGLGMLDGNYYPGADSNASGVAALISLAASLPRDPATGVIFVAFDGHSAKYAGARAFLEMTKGMRFSLMVSLDILGSTLAPIFLNRPNYLIMLGGSKYEPMVEMLNDRSINLRIGYDYYGSRDFTELFYMKIGEQTLFRSAGIGNVVFTSGITMNTNKRIDLPQTLDFGIMERRVELIRRWICTQIR